MLWQIIHNRGSHWEDVCIYDSLYTTMSEDTFEVIAQLVRITSYAVS